MIRVAVKSKMNVQVYSSDEWKQVAEDMHMNVFGEFRPKEMNRIDFALVAWEDNRPVGYFTCYEYDSKSIYLGYGGILADSQRTSMAVKAYKMGLDHLKFKYLRANTLIENTNTPMLKLAMSVGFKVTGIRYFNGSIMLEHSIEWTI